MSPFAVVFDQAGTFAATNAAERALEAHGFAIGPGQVGAPRAVMFGNYRISKWKNLDAAERRETHATLTGDGREGPLTFRLLPAAPDEAVIAAEKMRAAVMAEADAADEAQSSREEASKTGGAA